jgi:hypothetical protein
VQQHPCCVVLPKQRGERIAEAAAPATGGLQGNITEMRLSQRLFISAVSAPAMRDIAKAPPP